MATGTNRDVRLGVEVTTAGEDDLRRLAGAVRSLGQEGDPAAAEYARLANELDRLADQAGAVQGLRTLRQDVERLTLAETEAAAAVAATSRRYQEQVAATATLREAQQQAASAATAAKSTYLELNATLQRQVAEGKAAGLGQRELAAATEQARVAVINQRQEVGQTTLALRQADAALRQAAQSERQLAVQSERSATAAGAAQTALQQKAAALRTADAAADALGVSLTDLDAAETRFRSSLEATVASLNEQRAIQSTISALDDQAAASAQRLADRVRAVGAAYEQEQAGAAASAASTARVVAERERAEAATRELADAEARRAAAAREQADADRLAIIQANGLAEARARGRSAAESELAAIRESEQFTRRYAAAQAEAAAAVERESVQAMRALERAAEQADAEVAALTASLRSTENAARQFATATEAAAAAATDDVAATQARVRAAEALIASERGLTAAQSELANQRDRNRSALVGEAQALLTQTRATREAQQAIAVLATEARQAGQSLERAFGTVGIRSIDAIEAEIEQTSAALVRLTAAARAGALSQDELGRAAGAAEVKIARLRAEIQQVQNLPTIFERLNSRITGLVSQFGALSAAIATLGVAVRPVIEATVALEQMRRVLTTVTGSVDTARAQIEFLRQVSQQSGQAFDDLGQSYAKFAASALQSGISVEQTQEVFRSVALAAGNLGLSSDQAKRALEALSQIASKGTVTMEELRQQLGDALPGVLPLLAKELGLSQAELNKVVESGQLLASEAIPAIGRSLQALQGQGGRVEGLVASWNRFVNVVKQAGVEIVEGPLGAAAGVALGSLAGVIRDISVVAVGASEAFKLFGLGVLSVLDALRGNITLDQLKQQLSDFAVESGERLTNYKNTAYGAAEGNKALGDSATALGSSFARLSLDQQKAIDQAVLGAQVAEKRSAALKLEAESVQTLSALAGDEARARVEAAEASRRATLASEQQLAADQRVVESLRAAKTAIEERAKAEGFSADQIKATVDKLNEKIAKATADVEKTEAQTRALQSQTAALELAAKATGDQSKRIDELRAAVAAASRSYEILVALKAKDEATTAEVERAALALAQAKGLLKNAIDDVSAALDRQLALMAAEQKLAEAGIRLQIERARASQSALLAIGNESAARLEGIRIKELELSISRSGQQAKIAEAEATIRALDVMERELRATGQLTEEKLVEIEVRRRNAEAAILEAQASSQTNGAKEREIQNLRTGRIVRAEYNDELGRSRTQFAADSSAADQNTSAIDRNTEAVQRNVAARSNLDADGFVLGSDGQRVTQLGSNNIQDYTRDLRTGALVLRADAVRRLTAGGGASSAPTPATAPTPIVRAAEPAPAAAAPSSAPSRSIRVDINIGGRTSAINVASDQDATALTDVLRQLEVAANRTAG